MFNLSLLVGLEPSEEFLVGSRVVVVCKPILVFSLGPKLNNIYLNTSLAAPGALAHRLPS